MKNVDDNPAATAEASKPDALMVLERRLERTYKSRVETARRYQARGDNWNLALVLASLTTAAVSVVALSSSNVYGDRSEALLVVLGIVTLVVSVLVTSAQFQVQAEKFFRAYRTIQKLWVEADLLSRALEDPASRNSGAERIDAEYQSVLDDTNNHSPADFFKAFPGVRESSPAAATAEKGDLVTNREFSRRKVIVWASDIFTALPILLALGLLLLLIPAVVWFAGG